MKNGHTSSKGRLISPKNLRRSTARKTGWLCPWRENGRSREPRQEDKMEDGAIDYLHGCHGSGLCHTDAWVGQTCAGKTVSNEYAGAHGYHPRAARSYGKHWLQVTYRNSYDRTAEVLQTLCGHRVSQLCCQLIASFVFTCGVLVCW